MDLFKSINVFFKKKNHFFLSVATWQAAYDFCSLTSILGCSNLHYKTTLKNNTLCMITEILDFPAIIQEKPGWPDDWEELAIGNINCCWSTEVFFVRSRAIPFEESSLLFMFAKFEEKWWEDESEILVKRWSWREEEKGLLESTNIKDAPVAVEAVEAIAVAPTGSGWLWVPSYVVIRIDISSKHLCTYFKHESNVILSNIINQMMIERKGF